MCERGRMGEIKEILPPMGVFSPYLFYKNKLLFASQGPNTVQDESITRAFSPVTDPVLLVVMNGEVTVFDGHHRVGVSVLSHSQIPYKLLNEKEAHIVHRYPFYCFLKELKNHIGRFEEI